MNAREIANQHKDEYTIVCTDGTMITDGEKFRIVSMNINSSTTSIMNTQEDEYKMKCKDDIVVRDMNMASIQYMLESVSPQSMLRTLAQTEYENAYDSTYERVFATMLVRSLLGIKKKMKMNRDEPMKVEAIIDVLSTFNIKRDMTKN